MDRAAACCTCRPLLRLPLIVLRGLQPLCMQDCAVLISDLTWLLRGVQDPVMAPDGTVYERVAIEDWLTRHHVSPVSREPMRIEALKPVRAIAVTLKALQVVQLENEALKERLQILKQICNEPFQCSRLF